VRARSQTKCEQAKISLELCCALFCGVIRTYLFIQTPRMQKNEKFISFQKFLQDVISNRSILHQLVLWYEDLANSYYRHGVSIFEGKKTFYKKFMPLPGKSKRIYHLINFKTKLTKYYFRFRISYYSNSKI
jgi:hypothetical protein